MVGKGEGEEVAGGVPAVIAVGGRKEATAEVDVGSRHVVTDTDARAGELDADVVGKQQQGPVSLPVASKSGDDPDLVLTKQWQGAQTQLVRVGKAQATEKVIVATRKTVLFMTEP
eukprot:gene4269-20354_t